MSHYGKGSGLASFARKRRIPREKEPPAHRSHRRQARPPRRIRTSSAPPLYEKRSPVSAKLNLALLDDPRFDRQGKLILVTATTPTVSGEGKTVTSIGLVQGLERIGKRAIITSREPSLGPVFGMKGGAAGGGQSQVEPAEKINLHFHGDFHAITSAHNLLAALIDSHLFHGNELDLDPAGITWPRTLDMNDRALRSITVAVTAPDKRQRDGSNRPSGFLITAASEIMAILSLASGREDLRARLARIVIGQNRQGEPVRAADLDATGPMMALLTEALLPNLVQTTEGTPAMVHCGPFANIAHGTSSVISQQMGLRLADYVVNETGFASDLGFEKYMDLVSPLSGIQPAAAVLVTTVQSVRQQGEGDLERGFANLEKHIAIVRGFGLPVVVAINRFPKDTEEELDTLRDVLRSPRRGLRALGGLRQGRRGSRGPRPQGRRGHRSQPGPRADHHLRAHRLRPRKRSPKWRGRSTARRTSSSANRPGRTSPASRAGASAICPSASPKPSTRSPTIPSAPAPPPAGRSTSPTWRSPPAPAFWSSSPAP